MRPYLNLLFSIGLPVSVLFVVAATIYFSLDYDLDKAIKLGMLTGFLTGVGFSMVIAGVLLLLRKVRAPHIEDTQAQSKIVHESTNEAVDTKLILLMDKELAFEVVIHSIIDQDIGDVSEGNKRKGTISISTPEQILSIAVSPLTKHTSQIEIKADAYNTSIEKIIHYIKLKENSFLQY